MNRAICSFALAVSAALCSTVWPGTAAVSLAADGSEAARPAVPAEKPTSDGGQAVAPAEGRGGLSSAGNKLPAKTAGRAVSEKAFGDWTLQCLENNSAEPRCQVIHRSMSPDKKQVVMVMSLASIAKDKTGLQLALPLGFAVQAGVKLGFGSKFETTAAVSRCTVQGCLVEGECPPKMISAMKDVKTGDVTVRTVEGGTIKLALSLDGFANAFRAMQERDLEND